MPRHGAQGVGWRYKEKRVMPRLPFALLAACATVLLAAGTSADLKDVTERGTLRVLVASDEQPELFSFQATGEPGFERELVEGFARLTRVKPQIIQVASFDDI